jgi:hypothetical protein
MATTSAGGGVATIQPLTGENVRVIGGLTAARQPSAGRHSGHAFFSARRYDRLTILMGRRSRFARTLGRRAAIVEAAKLGWVSSYRISLHTVQDLDDEHFADLPEFPSLDPVEEDYVGEGRELGRADDEAEAIELAERLTGAAPDRWVNFGVAGEEYLDLVRSRRRPEANIDLG